MVIGVQIKRNTPNAHMVTGPGRPRFVSWFLLLHFGVCSPTRNFKLLTNLFLVVIVGVDLAARARRN